MKHLFGKTAFTVSQTDYRWEDVFLAAELWGEWPRVIQRAQESLALIDRAEAADELPFTEEEVDGLATEFRYARDLVRAEEMEAWLRRWGLEFEEWSLWISATLLRKRWGTEGLDLSVSRSASDLDRAFWTEAVCSRAVTGFLDRFGGATAVAASLKDGENPPPEVSDDEAVRMFPHPLTCSALSEIDAATLRERMCAVGRIELAFRHFEGSTLSPAAIAARIKANQTAWTKISYQLLSLPREDVAREALLGVKEDGLSLAEVAADARTTVETGTRCVDDFDKALRDRLLACQKGDLIGPVPSGGAFVLVTVLDKSLPSLSDPAVLEQARTEFRNTLISRETDNRVTWAGMS